MWERRRAGGLRWNPRASTMVRPPRPLREFRLGKCARAAPLLRCVAVMVRLVSVARVPADGLAQCRQFSLSVPRPALLYNIAARFLLYTHTRTQSCKCIYEMQLIWRRHSPLPRAIYTRTHTCSIARARAHTLSYLYRETYDNIIWLMITSPLAGRC